MLPVHYLKSFKESGMELIDADNEWRIQDTFTEGGIDAFRMNTTRPEDQQHVARTHRHHLQKLDVE